MVIPQTIKQRLSAAIASPGATVLVEVAEALLGVFVINKRYARIHLNRKRLGHGLT